MNRPIVAKADFFRKRGICEMGFCKMHLKSGKIAHTTLSRAAEEILVVVLLENFYA